MWKIAGGFALSAAAELHQGNDGHNAGFHSPEAHPHGLGFAPHDGESPMAGDADHLDVWHGANSPLGTADGDDHHGHALLPPPVTRGFSHPSHEVLRPGAAQGTMTYISGHVQSGTVDVGAVRGVARAHVRTVDNLEVRAPKRSHSDVDQEDDMYRSGRPRLGGHSGQHQLREAASALESSVHPRYSVSGERPAVAMAPALSGYHLPMSTASMPAMPPSSSMHAPASAFRVGSAYGPPPAAGSPGPAPGGDRPSDGSSRVDVSAILSVGARRPDRGQASSSSSAAPATCPAKPSGDGDVPSALVAAAQRLQEREHIDVLEMRGTSAAKPARVEDDDEEDDEEEHAAPGGSLRRQQARERRRQRKNDRERRRRQEVSDAMDDLAEVARVLTGTQRRNKSDKVTVLQAALRSIRGLTEGLRAVSALARTADPAACAPLVSEETAGIMTAALSGARR